MPEYNRGATLGNRQNNKKALENNFLVSKKKKKKAQTKTILYWKTQIFTSN